MRGADVRRFRAAVPAGEARGEPGRLRLGGALRAGAAARPVQGGGAPVPRATRGQLRQRVPEDQVTSVACS